VDETEAAQRRSRQDLQLAYRAAVESAVLLKNENSVLPLSAGKKIALVGPNAKTAQLGDYTAPGNMVGAVSLFEGLSARVSDLTCEIGCGQVTKRDSFDSAVEAVKQADVAILAMGDTSHYFGGIGWGSEDGVATCGEGFDSHDLLLPPCQKELIRACAATGTPVVLVLYTGRPYALTEELKLCNAIVQAWYPGEQGGHAVADLLLGNENFSGKLSISFPMSVGQLPCYYNHKVTARGIYRRPGSPENPGRDYVFAAPKALFRFGYGLSYSSYAYSNLEVKHLNGYCYSVSVDVENTSGRAGTEVVQLYLTDDRCRMSPYVERLRGFERVTIQPGERKTVRFMLDEKDLSFINERMQPEVEPGSFTVRIEELKAAFTVQ
jgi:beta-glucosidase